VLGQLIAIGKKNNLVPFSLLEVPDELDFKCRGGKSEIRKY